MDPVQVSPQSAARVRGLQEDLHQLRIAISELRDGKGKDNPNGKLLADALEHDFATKTAEVHRELAIMAGDGALGSVLGKGQSMVDAVGDTGPNVTLGQIIRGRGFGQWGGVSNDAKALILSDGAGGAIPGAVTAGIVDLARQRAILFQAGAQLMPMASPTMRVARMTAGPTAQWKPESAERSLDDQAFVLDAVEQTATTAFLYTQITLEASEDVVDLDQAIMNHFARQLALTFDEAGIAGTGIDQPVGLVNMGSVEDRILEANGIGEIIDHRPFVRAVGAVKAAHYNPSSVILTPGLWTELNCLQDTTHQPMRPPAAYSELNEYVSEFLPTGGPYTEGQHTAVVGDLRAMCFGVKTSAQIEISRLGAGFRKGSIEVRGYIRLALYLTNPEAICVMRGITLPTAGY